MTELLTIRGVASYEVPTLWPEVWGLLEPAVHPSEYTEDQLLDALYSQDLQLWIGEGDGEITCAMTTKIAIYDNAKVAVIPHVGGQFDVEFKDYLPRLKEWAIDAGAQYLRIVGRPGWTRTLREHFDETYSIMEARLCH